MISRLRWVAAAAALGWALGAHAAGDPVAEAEALLAQGKVKAAEITLKNAIRANADSAALRLALARMYVETSNFQDAEADLRLARDMGAPPGTVLPLLAQVWLARGEAGRVLREAAPGAYTPSENALIHALRARAMLQLRVIGQAEQSIMAARAANGDLPAVILTDAEVKLAQRRIDEAEALVDDLVRRFPGIPDVLAGKAQIRQMRGDAQGAVDAYTRLLLLRPTASAARLGRASMLLALNRDAEADTDVNDVLAARPNNALANFIKGEILFRAKRIEDAWSVMWPAMPELAANPAAQLLAAVICLELNNPAQARAFAERAVTLTADDPVALSVLADWWLRQNGYGKAVTLLEKAREKLPDDPNVLSVLGAVYSKMGKADEAAGRLSQAKAKGKGAENSSLDLQLGLARMGGEQSAAALDSLEQAARAGGNPDANAGLAIIALREGRFDDARARIDVYARQVPNSAMAMFLKGQLAMALGRRDEALDAIRTAWSRQPDLYPAAYALARLYRDDGNRTAEAAIYDEVLKHRPDDETSLIGRADMAQRTGDTPTALKLAAAAVIAAKASVPVAEYQMDLLLGAGRPDEALVAARRIALNQPRSAVAQGLLARALVANGKLIDGIDTYRRAAVLAPGVGHLQLAQALLATGQGDAARDALDEAVKASPGLLPAWELLISDEVRRRGLNSALTLARTADAGTPALAQLLSGNAYSEVGEHSLAVGAFRAAYDGAPPAVAGHVVSRLAVSLTRINRKADAAKVLSEWLAKAPTDLGARQLLAELQMTQGNTGQAIRNYEEILTIDRNNAVALNNLALLYAKMVPGKALELARRAFTLGGDQPTFADTYGWLLVTNGRPREAIIVLEPAARQGDPSIRYHLARAYFDSGSKDQAAAILQSLTAKIFPEQGEAAALYRRLTGQ